MSGLDRRIEACLSATTRLYLAPMVPGNGLVFHPAAKPTFGLPKNRADCLNQGGTQALQGLVSLLVRFREPSGLSTVRPRSDQGAALPLSLHARLRSPCASSIGVRPTPVSLPLPGRCCLFFIRNHGHSSVHQLPDAGSLESGSLAVDRFATLNRILSLECSAAGHPGVWGRTRSSLFCEAEV